MPGCPRCSVTSTHNTGSGGLCEACLLEETLSTENSLPGEVFGSYQILCEIGQGGIGVVYLAEQLRPIRREVALKAVKPGVITDEILARFDTERQALAALDHPHIARVFDAGTSNQGRPFFVMEYVDGLPITEYCDLHSLTVSERLAVFSQVCHAVDHAHRKGILHRDLKPSNILVAEDDGKPVPKIIDFGIAKVMGVRRAGQALQTEAGQLLGTIEYMSPEQAGLPNRGVDRTADVYSLGVVLYELLCGALPFDAERLRTGGLLDGLQIIREEQPPHPAERLRQLEYAADAARKRRTSVAGLQRRISSDVAQIVQTALAKDPQRRYASAAALARDLERHLRDQPVLAHAPGLVYRARKLAYRRRGAVAIVASTIAVIGAAGAIVSISRETRETRMAPKVRPLTSYDGYEIQPALSPDGKRFAFVWNGDRGNFDIYVRPVDGGDPIRLTTDPAHDLHPAWSPDGRSIAFLRTTPAKKAVFVVPSSGGAERQVVEISTNQGAWEQDASVIGRSPGPAWSPDGASLAIGNRAGERGPDCIYLISPETGTGRKLTSPEPDAVGDSLPAFSPKGRNVAFIRATSQRGITDLYVVPAAGGQARRITFDRKTISGLSWQSENRLVFVSNRSGGNMVWTIPASGGKPELIAIAGRNARDLSVSSGPGLLVFTEAFRNTNIWRVDLSIPGAPAEKLISTTRRNDSPKYSPDCKRIVFGSDRSGVYELWVSDADGSHARQVTAFGGLPVGTPRWSPDGEEIVFDGVRDGRSAIYIGSARGGAPRLFAADNWDNMMPSWSTDGRYVYFVRRESSGLRVWKKPAAGGPALQLTHRAGGEAVESPDGKLVYFSNGMDGVWQVSPDGAGEARVPGLEGVRHGRYFALTRRGAYFLKDVSPPWVIQFYNFATHRISIAARIEKPILFQSPNLSVCPDDRWLLYAELDDSGSDIMLLEDFG